MKKTPANTPESSTETKTTARQTRAIFNTEQTTGGLHCEEGPRQEAPARNNERTLESPRVTVAFIKRCYAEICDLSDIVTVGSAVAHFFRICLVDRKAEEAPTA